MRIREHTATVSTRRFPVRVCVGVDDGMDNGSDEVCSYDVEAMDEGNVNSDEVEPTKWIPHIMAHLESFQT